MTTALITGASRGFGHAVAAELARRHWDLVLDARTEPDLMGAAADLRDSGGGSVTAIAGSVTDPRHVERLVSEAESHGGPDLLVNNASTIGLSPQPRLDTHPLPILRDVLEVNLVGPLGLIQQALPSLRRTGGTIVSITSDAAVEAYEGWGAYGASKAALEQISNVLAAEEPGIRVYWFDPGDMNTRMHQEAFPGEDISDRPLPESRVPALMHLLDGEHPSGRYTAADFLIEATP